MQKINVLYIEDSPGDVRIIKELLENEPPYNYIVTWVEKLADTKDIVKTYKFDIILLDLNLPDSSGFSTLEQVQLILPETPIVVLTGSLDEKLSGLLIKKGAQDFLSKNSISSEFLKHSIRYAIERNISVKKSKENQEQFINLIEKNSDGIIVIDLNGNIKYINPAGEKLFSRSKEELINQSFGFPISLNEFTEIALVVKGGSQIIAEMRLSEINWEGENCYLAAMRDITDRKQIEQKNIEYSEKLKKANLDKDKFFSIIAHDLKSPFNGLLGLTELMEAESDNFSKEQLVRYVKKLNLSARNLFELLGNLLEWALMQKESIQFEPIQLDLYSIAEQNKIIIAANAERKNISIINNIEKKQAVFADEKMVQSIFRNLLTNAVKFTKSGGSITLESKLISEKMVEVCIIDTGIGMSKEIQKKLFIIGEDVGKKGTDGELSTGLGLLLCKEFVEKNAGKIWVESEVGFGSKFYFTLPCKE